MASKSLVDMHVTKLSEKGKGTHKGTCMDGCKEHISKEVNRMQDK